VDEGQVVQRRFGPGSTSAKERAVSRESKEVASKDAASEEAGDSFTVWLREGRPRGDQERVASKGRWSAIGATTTAFISSPPSLGLPGRIPVRRRA